MSALFLPTGWTQEVKPIYTIKQGLSWKANQWQQSGPKTLQYAASLSTTRTYSLSTNLPTQEPEKRELQFVGVLSRADQGRPLLLVRFRSFEEWGPGGKPKNSVYEDGGSRDEQDAPSTFGVDVFRGMNGAPVYSGLRLIGAIVGYASQGYERLAVVRPIDTMLQAFEPLKEDTGTPAPLVVRTGEHLTGFPQTFQSLMPSLQVSGLSPDLLKQADTLLEPFGLHAEWGDGEVAGDDKERVATTNSEGEFRVRDYLVAKSDLQAGDNIGVSLMTGDIQMTALGTVSLNPFRNDVSNAVATNKNHLRKYFLSGKEVRRGEVLAMGGPILAGGAGYLPVSPAFVHILNTMTPARSMIASFGPPIGYLKRDHAAASVVQLGAPAEGFDMIALECESHYQRVKHNFKVNMTRHPMLMPGLISLSVKQAIYQAQEKSGAPRYAPRRAKMRLEIFAEGKDAPVLQRENIFFDGQSIEKPLLLDVEEAVRVVSSKFGTTKPLGKIKLTLELADVAQLRAEPIAGIGAIRLNKSVYAPGDMIEVFTQLQPQAQQPFQLQTSIKIPETAAEGPALLMVQGGNTRVEFPPQRGNHVIADESLYHEPTDALESLGQRDANDAIVTRLILPDSKLFLARPQEFQENGPAEPVLSHWFSPVPAFIMNQFVSVPGSLPITRAHSVKTSHPNTGWIVQGLQTLPITIQRHRPNRALSPSSDTVKRTVFYSVDGTLVTQELEAPIAASSPWREPTKRIFTAVEKPQREGSKKKKPRPISSSKPGALRRHSWLQSSHTDFARGFFNNTEVTKLGTVQLESELTELGQPGFTPPHTLPSSAASVQPGSPLVIPPLLAPAENMLVDEQFVWSVAGYYDGDRTTFYAGTGPSGRLYQLKLGALRPWRKLETGEINVHAVVTDSAGYAYAGTSPKGQVWRFAPDGTKRLIFDAGEAGSQTDTDTKYVLSLAVYGDIIFVGTADGKIWRLPKCGGPKELICRLGFPAAYITSLLAVSENDLYAGTAEGGTIYHLTASNTSGNLPSKWDIKAIFESGESTITGLAHEPGKALFATCAPRGLLYRIPLRRDGELLPEEPQILLTWSEPLQSLQRDNSGTLWTSSGNAILQRKLDGTVVVLRAPVGARLSALALSATSDCRLAPKIAVGRSNFGGLFTVVPAFEGQYESTVHDAGAIAHWDDIEIDFNAPLLTTPGESAKPLDRVTLLRLLTRPDPLLMVETRTSVSDKWLGQEWSPSNSPWEKVEFHSGKGVIKSSPGRFLQVRFIFKSYLRSPELKSFRVNYRTGG